MKVALFCDLHFGARGDSLALLEHQRKSLNDFYFPIMEKEGITTVIIAGDLVDRRKYINFRTAKIMRECFLDRLEKKYNVIIIPGNHDCFHKNTNETNALNELANGRRFHLMIEPTQPFFNLPKELNDFLFLPWICQDNYANTMEIIKTTNAKYVVGHLELNGFEMYRGLVCEHGMDAKIFEKFDRVMTGHFHKPSKRGNISYLGAPWAMTWADHGDPRGFNIFDTETNELKFYQNPSEIFQSFFYCDSGRSLEEVSAIDLERYRNCYVKVFVENKTQPYMFECVIKALESVALDVKIVDLGEKQTTRKAVAYSNASMTIDAILTEAIDSTSLDCDKEKVKRFMLDLYNDASMKVQ